MNLTKRTLVLLVAAGLLAVPTGPASSAPEAPKEGGRLTNLAHLDFLLDQAAPEQIEVGHATSRLRGRIPALTMPWTYADPPPRGRASSGSAAGGSTNPRATRGVRAPTTPMTSPVPPWSTWAAGCPDQERGPSATPRRELLRGARVFPDHDRPRRRQRGAVDAARRRIQPQPRAGGTARSVGTRPTAWYWLARTLWAFGEGYAAFEADDPEFAAVPRGSPAARPHERSSASRSSHYGEGFEIDGKQVPAWLIVDGADASAEAVVGPAAYVSATAPAPAAPSTPRTTGRLSRGIAELSGGDARYWPFGALLPWSESRSIWHAWASQMPASLEVAADVIGEGSLAGHRA